MKKGLILIVIASIALMSTVASAQAVWARQMGIEKDGTWYRTSSIGYNPHTYPTCNTAYTTDLSKNDIDGVQCTIGYFGAETDITSNKWKYQPTGTYYPCTSTYGCTGGGWSNPNTGESFNYSIQQSYYNNFDATASWTYFMLHDYTTGPANTHECITCALH